MDRYLSPVLFEADPASGHARSRGVFELATARELAFSEDWLQRAIAENPDIVIRPCREAGLTDEAWMLWAREFTVESAGNIDILLVSESGRIAIIETKLSYNPEGRRSVVAQTLEYAIHLPAVDANRFPPVPEMNGRPFAEKEAVYARIQEGDYLLIVTGDRLDARAVKLGKSLLGRHLVNGWDLAMVEVAIFRRTAEAGSAPCLLVPHLRGAIIPEQRQVVRIVVEGDRPRVAVEATSPVAYDAPRRKQDEDSLFRAIPNHLTGFVERLRALRDSYPDFSWTPASASIVFRNRGFNILELYPAGEVRFRTNFFAKALGEDAGAYYEKKLRSLFPEAIESYAYATLDQRSAAELLALITEVLAKARAAA